MTSSGSESTQILTAVPTTAQPWRGGADLSGPEPCPHCQATIATGDEFCPRCGYQRGTWAAAAAAQAASGGAATTAPAPSTDLILRAPDGRCFGLPPGETVAGRGEVALRLDDSYISRQHARFSVDGDTVTVTDLGSSNGTYVDEQRLEPQTPTALNIGETFQLGQLALTLERNAMSASASEGDTTALLTQQPAAAASATGNTANPPLASTDIQLEAPARELSGWSLAGPEGLRLDLPLGTVSLGRKADQNDLVISDGFISGKHCSFDVTLTGLTVTDLGSTNGSFVGGERLERDMPTPLLVGNALRLGQTELVVELSGGAAAADTPDPEFPEPALGSLSEAPA